MENDSLGKQGDKTAEAWTDVFLKGWRPYAWIAALGFLIYIQAIWFDFSYLDDDMMILNNKTFLSHWSSVIQTFKEAYCNMYYRPILIISFIIDYHLAGISPGMYHFTNIIFHLVACCLLFLFLIKMKYRKDLSFLFTAIFTVHPVLTQAVAWIPGRNDELLTIFALLTLISLLNFIDTKKWKHFGWLMLFFTLALFTKESSLILVPIILAYLHLINKEKIFSLNDKVLAAGWLVIITIFFIMRHPTIKVAPDFTIFVMLKVMLANLPQIILFIGKAIFPMELSVAPLVQDSSFIYGAIVIILIAFSLVISKTVRYNFIIFGLLWFLISHIPPIMTVVAMEQRMHFAIIGFIILFMELDFIKNANIKKENTLIIFALILIIYSGVTFAHSKDTYKDKVTFWYNAATSSPHSPLAHRSLAEMYYNEWQDGKREKGIEEAEEECKKALDLKEDQPEAHNYLGLIYMYKGLYTEEQAKALKTEGKLKEAEAKSSEAKNILKESEERFKRAIEIYQDMYIKARESTTVYHDAYLNLGGLYYRQGRLDEAEKVWEKTAEANPKKALTHNNIGLIYLNRGTNALEESKSLKTSGKVKESEAKSLEAENMLKRAEEEFRKELEVNPECDKAYFNLGMLYSQQGKSSEAEQAWQKTIELNPKQLPDIYRNLVMYYKAQKNYPKFWYYIEQCKRIGMPPPPPEVLKDVPPPKQ